MPRTGDVSLAQQGLSVEPSSSPGSACPLQPSAPPPPTSALFSVFFSAFSAFFCCFPERGQILAGTTECARGCPNDEPLISFFL